MRIAVIGTGYVGLVAGACLSDTGFEVYCVDIDEAKIEGLKRARIPIYEPGLEQLVKRNVEKERLHFTTDLKQAVEESEVIFIAVGTPPDEDGSADLRHVIDVAASIGKYMNDEKVVITKSTVPVGTAAKVRHAIGKHTDRRFHVCSNPEFLKEGAAVEDFMKPDRVVLGVDDDEAAAVLRTLFEPFVRTGHEIMIMDVASAEITKYAANAMLATRISFMNMIARLCAATGANVEMVRKGIGSDSRIGPSFLFPGVGYGGSCLVGRETVLVRQGGSTRLMRLDALFEELEPSSAVPSDGGPPEIAWPEGLEVLSWSPFRGPEWRHALLATRRHVEGDIVEIRTKLGRRIRCTPDHPFVVSAGDRGELRVKLAEELTTEDWLPIALGDPQEDEHESAPLEIAAALPRLQFANEEVIVRSEAVRSLSVQAMTAVIEHPRGRARVHDIRRTGALRLDELLALGLSTRGAAFGTARNGTFVPDSLVADEAFWRVVGLYLAEGFCSRDGRRIRLGWCFHPTDEMDLVDEVASFWRGHGVKADVWRSASSTTCLVSISSRILGKWWVSALGVGADCYGHRLPDLSWGLPVAHRRALLSGLWQGDGSWSYINGGPSVVLEWGTVSRELADGVLRLLGGLGVAARMKVGRTRMSTVDTYWVVVSGAAQVEQLIDLVKPSDRAEVVAALESTKRIAPTGYRVDAAAWVRVVDKRRVPFSGEVYSLEVPGTQTFVTTAGLVVHNCFPKDVQALVRTTRQLGIDGSILEAVESLNHGQKRLLLDAIVARFGEDLSGRTFAVWGLAFKPNTDDMRDAPSLVTIEGLLERGARVTAHDPVAIEEARRRLGDRVEFGEPNYAVLQGADALVIHTEWHPYRRPDFPRMKELMAEPIIFDGRNLYGREMMADHGFEYHSVGRPPVIPERARA
jgi:UDPglucose 6-dehydrogenase